MTITITWWQFILVFLAITAGVNFVNGLVCSLIRLFDQTIMKTVYDGFHKKGGIKEQINKKLNIDNRKPQIGFVDRTESK